MTGEARTPGLGALDHRLLAETLALAARGGREVHPNPNVGALIVREGTADEVIGRGYHRRYGGKHAEPFALVEAGGGARGAILYCNLEPCSYRDPDKHQPPCTAAILEAGVKRLVIGQLDPNPRIRGDGVRQLRAARVQVVIAPDPVPFWRANPVFTTVMSLGRPFVHAVTSGDWAADDRAIVYEAVATSDTIDTLSADVRSILLHCPDPDGVSLPADWQIDYVDGRPTTTWEQALRRALAWADPEKA